MVGAPTGGPASAIPSSAIPSSAIPSSAIPSSAPEEDQMDAAVMPWLLAQLGTDTDQTDLTVRYLRLGTARAVALEILRERYAELLAQPTGITVTNVVAINTTANLAAYERKIAALEAGNPPAPDDPVVPATDDTIGYLQLVPRQRR